MKNAKLRLFAIPSASLVGMMGYAILYYKKIGIGKYNGNEVRCIYQIQ